MEEAIREEKENDGQADRKMKQFHVDADADENLMKQVRQDGI